MALNLTLMEGDTAPEFQAVATDGRQVSLSDFRGSYVLLYFYPRDDTPGCTKESCAFRDEYSALKKKGAVVLGVSIDSVKSHAKFTEKYSLPFPLLSDEGKFI